MSAASCTAPSAKPRSDIMHTKAPTLPPFRGTAEREEVASEGGRLLRSGDTAGYGGALRERVRRREVRHAPRCGAWPTFALRTPSVLYIDYHVL